MENKVQKKALRRKENFKPKMTAKKNLKILVITYKSQILKFKLQQKVLNKKDAK